MIIQEQYFDNLSSKLYQTNVFLIFLTHNKNTRDLFTSCLAKNKPLPKTSFPDFAFAARHNYDL